MEVRYDITDLSKKVSSFAEFLKQLHGVSLDQFNLVNKLYMEYKDLEYNSFNSDFDRISAFAGIAFELFEYAYSGYNTNLSDSANGLEFTVSPIMWINETSGDRKFQSIIDKVFGLIVTEKKFIEQQEDLSKLEWDTMSSIDRTLGTINILKNSISQSSQDGSNLFSEMWEMIRNYVFNTNLDHGHPDHKEGLAYLKKALLDKYYSTLTQHAKDCFKILLKAELEMYDIDEQSRQEAISLEEFTWKSNDEIDALTEKIQQLEGEIKEAMNASEIISKNNLEIAEATAKIEDIEKYIQKLDSDEASTQAQIAVLDPTSETYEADLAALQATIAKIQTAKADAMEKSSMIQQSIAEMSAQNAELSSTVDQLDEYQAELDSCKSDLKAVFAKLEEETRLVNQNIDRLGRKRLYLPTEENPNQYGGGLSEILVLRIRTISGIADWSFSETGILGVKGKEGLIPAIAFQYAHVFNDLGFGDELITKFNFPNPIQISNVDYLNIFSIVEGLNNTTYLLEMAKKAVDNYSNINFTNPVAESLEMEVNLEKLDAKKGEVDATLLKETTAYDALTQEMSDTNSQIQNLEASREQLNGDIKATIDSIENYTASISNDTESLSQAQVTKADAEAIKPEAEATKANAEQVKAEAQASQDTAEGVKAEAQAEQVKAQQVKAEAEASEAAAQQVKAEAEGNLKGLKKDLVKKTDMSSKTLNSLRNYQNNKSIAEGDLEQAKLTKTDSESMKIAQEQAKADYLATIPEGETGDQTIIDSFDLTIANLEDTIAQAQATIAQSQAKIEEADLGISTRNIELKQLTADIAQIEGDIAQAEATIAQADAAIAEAEATIAQATVIMAKAKATIAEATATISQADAVIAKADAAIAEAEATIAQADATIAQAQSEIDVLILAIQSSTDSKMSAESSLNSLLEQLRTIENSLNELYSTMESLKEKSSIAEKAIAELTAFIDNYDADRASMVSFIDEMTVGYDQTLADYKLTLRKLYSTKMEIESTLEDLVQQITIVKSKSNIRNNRKEESN